MQGWRADIRYEDAVYEEESSKDTVKQHALTAGGKAVRPVKELAGFEKVFLKPGETKKVHIFVKGGKNGEFPGVGNSVRDIRLVIKNKL